MNPIRLGRSIRALRLRLRWRQRDLAERAAVGQQTVSDVERGRATTVGLPRLLRIAAALDADLDLVIRWRGGTLDRLLDERHAAMCAASAHRLRVLGLDVLIEVSYAYYAERGSIDVLGWRASTSTLVVVEVKTELTSIEATLRKHDEKIRLGPRIARDRFGQPPAPWSGCSCSAMTRLHAGGPRAMSTSSAPPIRSVVGPHGHCSPRAPPGVRSPSCHLRLAPVVAIFLSAASALANRLGRAVALGGLVRDGQCGGWRVPPRRIFWISPARGVGDT